MTLDSRGREHLANLLGHAEQVVRVTPADILILTGVSSDVPMEHFENVAAMLTEAGVIARGIMVLGKGMTVDSIDLEQLLAQDQAARAASVTGQVDQTVSNDSVAVDGLCPLCDEIIPISVKMTVQATRNPLKLNAVAYTDQVDLGMHSLVCRGEPGEDV